MKKLKLLMAFCALLLGWSNASAQSWTVGAEVAAGDYYLYNVGSGRFLNRGHNYYYRSLVDGVGSSLTLTADGSNYFIKFNGVDNKYFGADLYVDKASNNQYYASWTFESVAVDGFTNAYRLKCVCKGSNTDNNGKYLIWGGNNGDSNTDWASSAPTENGYWLLIPKSTRENYRYASLDNTFDMTYVVKNADFEQNSTQGQNDQANHNGWTGTDWDAKYNSNNTGAGFGTFGEQWTNSADGGHLSDRKIEQTINSLPGGIYKVTISALAAAQGKGDKADVSGAKVYVNSTKQNVATGEASQTFTFNNIEVTNGSLTIGYELVGSDANWIAIDNVRLYYCGPSNGMDITSRINNAVVTSTTGWTNGRISTNQQYTGAPDNTYMDTWNATLDQNQTIQLPAGYYLLTAATRASADVTAGSIYASAGGSDLGRTSIHHEGSSGNLIGNGWAWTRVPFNVDVAKDVKIGFYSECGSAKWAGADDFHLTYYTSELEMKKALLNEVVRDANAWAEKVTTTPTLETQLSASAPSCSTVEEYNTAITNLTNSIAYARATSPVYPEFVRIKDGANSIKGVEYTATSGSYSTFTSAISTQTEAAESAITAEAITTATSVLKSAIKTYISNAEPKNDGEYFDITCLMENPDFENGVSGWTYVSAPSVNWSNCEYYQSEFDINQTVSGLPTGSYSLNVQAFQRPGWADAVWTAYNGGTDNASSVLYINSITSKVKNIAADAQSTPKLGTGNWGDWPNDSRVGEEGSYMYLPNSQQGAKLYFDASLYDATCAAVVTDADEGSLKLGFKSTKTHVDGDWTIFDNFRLYYYGSSLLVYYKQYLPQLKAEVSADLSNGAYANVLISSEDEALDAALAAEPASETEEAYAEVIDNLVDAQAAFRAAAPSYDAMVAAKGYETLTKISENIGAGVFQYNETTNNALFSAYETAKSAVDGYTFTTSSTAASVQTLVDALDDAIDVYNNQALNAPNAEKRYNVSIVEAGKAWDGNAVTFIAGGRNDQGNYSVKYLAPANENLNQALKFTAVAGEANTYKVSAIRVENGSEQYLTTGSTYGGDNYQIRTTDDASAAMLIKIEATTTDNQFQLRNVAENKIIANNNNNDMYTANSANFTIAEASQATVDVEIEGDKNYATRIFPFTPELPTGVVAYSCEATDGDVLNLVEEKTPAANTPYILFAEGGYTGSSLTDWGTGGATSVAEGLLTGVYTETVAPVGSYVLQNNETEEGSGIYKFGFYKVVTNEEPTVPACRCYLTDGGSSARSAFFFPGGDITGIKAVEALTSGKVQIFNASGAQIPALQKGMNIIRMEDGTTQKVMVK